MAVSPPLLPALLAPSPEEKALSLLSLSPEMQISELQALPTQTERDAVLRTMLGSLSPKEKASILDAMAIEKRTLAYDGMSLADKSDALGRASAIARMSPGERQEAHALEAAEGGGTTATAWKETAERATAAVPSSSPGKASLESSLLPYMDT